MDDLDLSGLGAFFCCEGRTVYDSCFVPQGQSLSALFQNPTERSSRWVSGDIDGKFGWPKRFLAQKLSIIIPENTPQEFIDAVSVELCVGETSYLNDPLKNLIEEESHHGRCDSICFSRPVGNTSSGTRINIEKNNMAIGVYIPPVQNFRVSINVGPFDGASYKPIELFCELSGLFFRPIEEADISDD